MQVFYDITHNSVVGTCAVAYIIAQMLKVLLVLLCEKKVDFTRFIGSGGMPSSHAAIVSSLTVKIGIEAGFDSHLFAIAFVLALVVMYDASGIRRAAGEQAKILNKIVDSFEKNEENSELLQKRLKELLGHTPFEVLVGCLLGICIALV